ncbi:MAG: tetratricopeptide repeat protein, partial [Terricaulis sp.]
MELFEVDLRWGITKEQMERGETLPTLLAEIDRCRPYFIGVLGDRYGWVPPASALTEELKATYPSLADAGGASVTAMEIMHGVLSNPDTAARAFFFERDPSWNWAANLSDADRAYLEPESDADHAKLEELKASIRAKGAQVQQYKTPADIGPAVREALGAALDARFPEAEAPDPFNQTMRLHRAYARERRGMHIGAASYREDLDQWMSSADAPPILITGASGGGKSTLVANWLHAWRNTHSNDIVFEHYLGASPDSADPMLLMRRVWEQLNRDTGEIVDLPGGDADLMDVSSQLAQRIAQASAFAQRNGGQILIALDGLDKLSSEQNLRWLPNVPRVKLLASSLDGEAKSAALSRGWTVLEVKPLASAERGEFIELTLRGWGRKLLREQIDAILAHAQAGNPLFLRTVLDELRVSATNALLKQRLGHYLGARDMPDLFDRVLQRLEGDCEAGLVAKALPLIWASRAGLEEAEIIAITGATPLAWATLRNGLGDGLRDQAGRVAFSHDYLSQAVRARYLATGDTRRAAHLAIAGQFNEREPDERQAEELPYQLEKAEAWDRLEALLIDLDRFELLRARGDGELLSYWLPLKAQGREPEALLCGAFETRAGKAERWTRAEIDFAFDLGRFLDFAGERGDGLQRLGEQRTVACERILGPEHPSTLASISNLAGTLTARGDLGGAQSYEERTLEVSTRILGPEHPHTLGSMNNLAQTLRARGDLGGAQSYEERTLEVSTRILGPEHPSTLTSMSNLAHTLSACGNLDGAQKLGERALEARARTLGPEHPSTLTSLNNLARTLYDRGDLDGAHKLQERVLEVRTRILGAEHPSTLTSMNNLAQTLYALGDFEGAQTYQERVLEASTRILGPEHPFTLTSMSDLAGTLSACGNLDGAQKLEERVLEAETRILGPEHPSTLTSMNNLAQTLRARSDLEGAQSYEERVLEASTRILGPEHPSTLTSMNNLAQTLYALGDFEGAQTYQERV